MKRILSAILLVIIFSTGCSHSEIGFKDYSEEKEELVYNYLLENGDLSPVQAASITAAIKQQSNFDTTVHDSSIGSTGLMCWCFTRKDRLAEYAQIKGKEVTDLYLQLDFILEEINSDSEYYQMVENKGYSVEEWENVTTPEESVLVFTYLYVRPGYIDEEALQALSREIYEACTSSKDRQSVRRSFVYLCFILYF